MIGFDPELPYNGLPLLPPANIEVETRAILKRTVESRAALAELKRCIQQIPNPKLLLDSLILQEAKSSSEIENIVTTQDELFRAASSAETIIDPATKEVLRYREALWQAFEQLKENKPFSTRLFESIYQTIKQTSAGIRKTPGTKIATLQGDTIYTPP